MRSGLRGAAMLCSIVLGLSTGGGVRAQESCENLQHQLQILRSSGGAGSQWEAFALQRMQELGCFGPRCPANTQECGDHCCNNGFYCSKYGCTPQGAVDCGHHYCNPGQQCSRSGGCQPAGTVDCGDYYCPSGQRCASGHKACLASGDTDCNGYHCGPGMKCAVAARTCLAQSVVDCGLTSGVSCQAGTKCSRDGKRCLNPDQVDCGSYACNAGMKCGSGDKCLASSAIDCGGGKSCPAGHLCVRGGAECLTREQIAERAAAEQRRKLEEAAQRAKEAEERRAAQLRQLQERQEAAAKAAEVKRQAALDAKRKAEEAKLLAAQIRERKIIEELADRVVKAPEKGPSILTSDLLAKLPQKAITESLKSATESTLKGTLSMAMPASLTSAQKAAATKELADLWTTNLSRTNLTPIAGRFAGGVATGIVVDYVGDRVGEFAAKTVAKHTSNTFAIEFARSSSQLAIVDAYAAKGGIPGVLVTNGVLISQASIGLAVDTRKAATSIRAYEVQIDDAIARAHRETDPGKRERLLRTATAALSSLKELKESHPVISTLSNITIPETTETLRSWAP